MYHIIVAYSKFHLCVFAMMCKDYFFHIDSPISMRMYRQLKISNTKSRQITYIFVQPGDCGSIFPVDIRESACPSPSGSPHPAIACTMSITD
jgi:hypothetical protein